MRLLIQTYSTVPDAEPEDYNYVLCLVDTDVQMWLTYIYQQLQVIRLSRESDACELRFADPGVIPVDYATDLPAAYIIVPDSHTESIRATSPANQSQIVCDIDGVHWRFRETETDLPIATCKVPWFVFLPWLRTTFINIAMSNPGTDVAPYPLAIMQPPMPVADNWTDHVQQLYRQFRAEYPEPESDDEFISWLENRGWTRVEDAVDVTITT